MEKQPEKPTIDTSLLKPIKINAGEDLKISLPITGHPPPTVSWELDGKPVDSPLTKLDVSTQVSQQITCLILALLQYIFNFLLSPPKIYCEII